MKYALKRLTASDLTLFEWHFKHLNAGNQKAINLNADVFVDELFPALPDTQLALGKLPIDLFIYGPGGHDALNLQRKIIKGATYKNWRLNGEFIHNPDGQPDRFNELRPDDIAVLAFDGAPVPDTLHLVLVAAGSDQNLHALLAAYLGAGSMLAVSEALYGALVNNTLVPKHHALHGLFVGADLEDIALGAAAPRARAARRPGRPIDREQLAKGRAAAALIGRTGEEIVAAWLEAQKEAGVIDTYEWVSDTNAVAPFDFTVVVKGARRRIEVKSTSGAAGRPFPISMAEIEAAATSPDPYDIIRVGDVDVRDGSGNIHRCEDIRDYANQVLAFSGEAPLGCMVDGVSIDPAVVAMQFVKAFAVAR